MNSEELEQLKYPIGQFNVPEMINDKYLQLWMRDIELLPSQIRLAVAGMDDEQLDTPYRPDGWTVRQVVHHVADSHMNGYIRVKLALTEENPVIKPYEEQLWAELPDSKLDIDVSLKIIDSIHTRWVTLLRGLNVKQFSRTFYHPGNERDYTLEYHTGLYSWHGRHHVAHITHLKTRQGWY
jgi:DinB superfamily